MARIRGVAVSKELWQDIMTTGWTIGADGDVVICERGLPKGAKWSSAVWADDMRAVIMYFEHDSFDELEPGEPPPLIDVVFSKLPLDVWLEKNG